MSSYLSSNQPYQRVDDGIGAGLIGGAVVGGAMAGAAHKWGKQASSGLDGMFAKRQAELRKTDPSTIDDMSKHMNKLSKSAKLSGQVGSARTKFDSTHDKYFNGATAGEDGVKKGGWKGKAMAYGGSVLAGSLLGGVADGIID